MIQPFRNNKTKIGLIKSRYYNLKYVVMFVVASSQIKNEAQINAVK